MSLKRFLCHFEEAAAYICTISLKKKVCGLKKRSFDICEVLSEVCRRRDRHKDKCGCERDCKCD